MSAPVYMGLVHHPVRDRLGDTVTTAVTNLDVHDLSRSARTYGLAGYLIVTPLEAQRVLVQRILDHWAPGAPGAVRVPRRAEALALCEVVESVASCRAQIQARHGAPARVVVTSASYPEDISMATYGEVRRRIRTGSEPILILFGTGYGMTEELLRSGDLALPAIRPGEYNHLSVRAAAAIILDRLLGPEMD